MKKHCFAYFNKLGGFYLIPFFVDQKDEFVKSLHQALFACKKDDLESLLELDLYYVGCFDNEEGKFESSAEFVCTMSPIASEILSKKFGVKEDGQA